MSKNIDRRLADMEYNMDKSYTAQEMREEARIFEARGGSSNIAAMLHQAADEIEREERREKKYEYAVKWNDGLITQISQTFPCKGELDAIRKYNLTVVRREVGEWEEVKE